MYNKIFIISILLFTWLTCEKNNLRKFYIYIYINDIGFAQQGNDDIEILGGFGRQ